MWYWKYSNIQSNMLLPSFTSSAYNTSWKGQDGGALPWLHSWVATCLAEPISTPVPDGSHSTPVFYLINVRSAQDKVKTASAGTLMPSAKTLLLLLVFVIHFYKEWKILGFRNYSLNKHLLVRKCYIAINIYFRGSKSHGMEIKNVKKLT